MKKLVALGLAAAVATAGLGMFAGCSGEGFAVGLIALHDSNSTYDKNFIDAMEEACDDLDVELIIKTNVPETNDCYDAASDLVDQGCDVIFADSFGHETHVMRAAEENPLVEFCHATGTNAHISDLPNFHNAFASIYEGRYLAGVAAGMKLVEMYKGGELEGKYVDGNIKIGYVGAYTYAEVISGYTSFYLGAKSIVEEEIADHDLVMDVQFTGSWFDEVAERNAANTLIEGGAVLISQHADSMGAPAACEKAGVPNVSYNGSTASECPDTYIVSSRINWVPYFKYMITQAKGIYETRQAAKAAADEAGEEIDLEEVDISEYAIVDDWTGTIDTGSVVLTELGSAAAAGTQEKIDEVKAQLQSGALKVFDTSKFTVTVVNTGDSQKNVNATVDADGHLTGYKPSVDIEGAEAVKDGVFEESTLRSAPYFDVQIDGITLLNAKF